MKTKVKNLKTGTIGWFDGFETNKNGSRVVGVIVENCSGWVEASRRQWKLENCEIFTA